LTDHLEKIDSSSETTTSIGDGMILDYITGKAKKESEKELVRQRIARALFHEYGISVDDMEPDFPVKVNGKRKNIDIVIFQAQKEHTQEHIIRVVLCQKEPKNGKKGSFKMRDHEQAQKDLEELKNFMAELDNCKYGLWTNGIEFFFLEKEILRFDIDFKPVGDWPAGDETTGTRSVHSEARMRRAEPEMLRTAFRRCHNFIHGNEGMPKDAAFWQFLFLIFAKMYDELSPGNMRRFWASPTEQFDPEGRKNIRNRIIPLFDEVKVKYASIFQGNEEITLSDRALAFMVSELAKYDLGRTDMDAKGAAYQEIVGTNLRGDRGQYFTPRGAIKLMVEMLDPKPHERVLDPACGTGGFLIAVLGHILKKFREEANISARDESTEEFFAVKEKIGDFSMQNLFACDFDPFLIKAASMNVVMGSNKVANLFHLNSLEFPAGHLDGVKDGKEKAPLGSMDVVLTNPPFGSDIPITDPNILRDYDLAHVWERTEDGNFRNTGKLQGSVAPEVLFIERCVQWLKPGGRMGIVLPDGILGNPGDEYIRWWILRHTRVLASVDLPIECFVVEATVNILTSLLFLKKKTKEEISAEDFVGVKEYPVFMAVVEKVGYDRRGNTLYKRRPDGEEVIEEVEEEETIRIGDRRIKRTLKRKQKILDNDLPLVAEAYRKFREENKEPGL